MTVEKDAQPLVIFDLNKTLIRGGSWYDLNIAMGITPEEDELLYRIGPEKEGALGYHEWLLILKKLIISRGRATQKAIEETLLNYTFIDGAQETVAALMQRGCRVAIISGGFNLVVDDVAHKLGIEHGYNNSYLVFNKDGWLEDILTTWDEDRFKPLLVQSVCRRFGIHPKDAYYVGDGDNDTDVFMETTGVAFQPSDSSHEPWKRAAIDRGELFSERIAATKAKFTITHLSQLCDVVR